MSDTQARRAPLVRGALVTYALCVAASAAGQPTARQPGGSAEAPANPPPPAAQVAVRMGEHPVVRVGTMDFVVRARLETSFRSGSPAEEGVVTDWRRRRVQVETSYKRLDFELSHEFGDPAEPERDAFVNIRLSRPFELTVGRFKVPFGRDALKSGANLDLVSRSMLGRRLAPGRDVGVAAHGRLGRVVSYDAGYFLHDGDNARSPNTNGGAHAWAGRVELTPAVSGRRSTLEDLEIGVAVLGSRTDRVLGLRGETVFGDGVFFERAFVNGPRLRLGVDGAWSRGPLGLVGEFARTSDARQAMGLAGEDLPNLSATAWYLGGSWVVTGERKRARVEPRRAIVQGGWGAVEVAARIERLSFSAVTYPGGAIHGPRAGSLQANNARAATVGVNWFLHPRARVQGNIVFETVNDPSRSPAPLTRGRFRSSIVNLQFLL